MARVSAARQGQMFWIDPIHSLVVVTERQTRGATFGTRDLDQVAKSADEGFRPVFIANAPDGSLHIADFYEHYIAHGQHYQSQIDPTTGRIYRLRGKGSTLEQDVNLASKSADELIALLSHPNKWHRQTAARVLGWRATPVVQAKLRSVLASGSAPLAALWALHQAGGLDGQDITLRAADIRSVEPTGRSLMPEGLLDDLNPNSEIGMGSAAAPAAVRRALAPNSEASDNPKRLEHFAHPSEPRGRGSLRPRRARSPKSTSEFGLNDEQLRDLFAYLRQSQPFTR